MILIYGTFYRLVLFSNLQITLLGSSLGLRMTLGFLDSTIEACNISLFLSVYCFNGLPLCCVGRRLTRQIFICYLL